MLNGITCRCIARIFFSLALILPTAVFAADIETLLMPGKVIEGHKKWEDTCSKCHKVFGELGQSKLCLDCHDKIESDIKKKRGYHGRYSQVKRQECRSCHTEHIGRDGDIVKLDKETFDHHLTDFKLKGTHKKVDCRLCHKKISLIAKPNQNVFHVIKKMIRTKNVWVKNTKVNVKNAIRNPVGKRIDLITIKPNLN